MVADSTGFLPVTLHDKRGKEINPDLFKYLFAFVWRCQLPRAQDFIQAMADISCFVLLFSFSDF